AASLGSPRRVDPQIGSCGESVCRRCRRTGTRGKVILGHFLPILGQRPKLMSFDLILPFLRPIEGLLLDEDISEIMGNPDSSWWVERDGILHSAPHVSFSSDGLRTGLEVVANKLGKKLDEDNPVLNAQLPDGSRLAAVIPPVVRPAPAMVIR